MSEIKRIQNLGKILVFLNSRDIRNELYMEGIDYEDISNLLFILMYEITDGFNSNVNQQLRNDFITYDKRI